VARSLSIDLCKRLARLLPLLSSDQPGEVTATAAAIGRALKAAERDWHDLVAVLTSVPAVQPKPAHRPQRDARGQAIDSEYVIELVHNIRQSGCYLSAKATGFLDSLEDRADSYELITFSEKQWEWFVALLQQASVDFDMA
jgi:hypothetical protein